MGKTQKTANRQPPREQEQASELFLKGDGLRIDPYASLQSKYRAEEARHKFRRITLRQDGSNEVRTTTIPFASGAGCVAGWRLSLSYELTLNRSLCNFATYQYHRHTSRHLRRPPLHWRSNMACTRSPGRGVVRRTVEHVCFVLYEVTAEGF